MPDPLEELPWVPQTISVAPHLRHFLRGEHGTLADDFDTETTITKAEVERAIVSTAADVLATCGPIPEALHDLARKTTAIGAAAESVIDRDERGKELYRELRDLYEARLARLRTAVRDALIGVQDAESVQIAGSIRMPSATRW